MSEPPFDRRALVYKNNNPPPGRFPRWLVALVAGIIVTGVLLGAGLFLIKRRLTEQFDVLIVNGSVIDGSGSPARRETIGIRDGRVVPVAWPSFAEAPRRINAKGMVVAPGFIDVHTHIEGNVSSGRRSPLLAPNFIAQGVTTIITGNCGRSALALTPFFEQLQTHGTQINIGSLAGHNTIRKQVMGEAGRAPTAEELEKMRGLVGRAMQDGALGFSTGLEYTPGAFADAKEIQALAAVANQYHGIYTTHMRDEGNGVVASLSEAIDVARAVGIPVQVSHLKWRGHINWGKARGLIDMIQHAQSEGLRVKCDAYPYTASSTTLDVLIPKSAREGGVPRLRERLQNPDERQRIIAAILEQMRSEGWDNFSFARVAYCDFAPEYNGLTIPEITDRLKNSNAATARPTSAPDGQSLSANGGQVPDAQSQAETICRLAARGAVQMIYEAMSEDDVDSILQFSDCMLGSDSNIRNGEGRPHPRGYGSAPRWFSLFVEQRKVMRMEEAVRRMTLLPAETFGLTLRGKLAPGYWADIVIFDPATIKDEATYENPFRAPDGIEVVLVNGKVALERGQTVATDAGQVIKRKD